MNRRHLIACAGATAAIGLGASFAGMGSDADYARHMARLRILPGEGARPAELVRVATLAASGHNTQPWRFALSANEIRIEPDLSRRTPVVDPDDHHLYVSLGCAAENLAIAGAATGSPGDLHFDSHGDGSISFSHGAAPARPTPLYGAIARRQSARIAYDGRPLSPANLAVLARAAEQPGVDCTLITAPSGIARVRDLVVAANTVQMADRAFVRELKHWMRFNASAALSHGDGLYSAASNNPSLSSWAGALMFDVAFTAAAENEKCARQLPTSSGVVIFTGAEATPANWISVGRACQRFALQATALGLKLCFVNQPVEVASFRPELAELAGVRGKRPDIVMRFGFGPDLPMSPRRGVAALLAQQA